MKTRMTLAAIVTLVLVLGGLSTVGQAPRRVEALMVRKLRSSQAVLEGLVTENFELMGRHAQQLRLFSQETDWNVLQTQDYQRLSDDFRRAANDLEKSAQRKNLDAASVAYIKLTLTCIDCHRHIRVQRAAK